MSVGVEIFLGLCILIPIIVVSVINTKQAISEGDYNKLIDLILDYVEQAETKFPDGPTRKAWVMTAIDVAANSAHIPYNEEMVAKMIDDIVALTKKVNK